MGDMTGHWVNETGEDEPYALAASFIAAHAAKIRAYVKSEGANAEPYPTAIISDINGTIFPFNASGGEKESRNCMSLDDFMCHAFDAGLPIRFVSGGGASLRSMAARDVYIARKLIEAGAAAPIWEKPISPELGVGNRDTAIGLIFEDDPGILKALGSLVKFRMAVAAYDINSPEMNTFFDAWSALKEQQKIEALKPLADLHRELYPVPGQNAEPAGPVPPEL